MTRTGGPLITGSAWRGKEVYGFRLARLPGTLAGAARTVTLGGDRAALVADQVRPADGVAAFLVVPERGEHPYLAR